MTDTPLIDEGLRPFATATQARYLDAVNEHGGYRNAAKALGVAHSVISRGVAALKRKAEQAARQATFSPPGREGFIIREVSTALDADGIVRAEWRQEGPDPGDNYGGVEAGPERDGHDGWHIGGVSTLYDSRGAIRQQWVKTNKDRDQARTIEAIREFVEHLAQDCRGLAPAIQQPPTNLVSYDMLAAYVMGDPHFGMYAWAEESGEDFDLDTAERQTCAAIDRLVGSAPAAATGLLLNLGDFFHADNSSNQTPGHGHALDVDTRYAKVMQVGLRAMKHCIMRLLEKHERVVVWNLPGNHDPHSSFMLALALDAFFSNEPRVHVDLSPGLYKYLRHGKTLIGAHHGHGAKMDALPGIMACDEPQAWGLTEFRYFLLGHIHHKTAIKEHPGCVVESFNTLAARDAWHAGKGYRAQRHMQCIGYHAEYGEVERHTVPTAMLERRAA